MRAPRATMVSEPAKHCSRHIAEPGPRPTINRLAPVATRGDSLRYTYQRHFSRVNWQSSRMSMKGTVRETEKAEAEDEDTKTPVPAALPNSRHDQSSGDRMVLPAREGDAAVETDVAMPAPPMGKPAGCTHTPRSPRRGVPRQIGRSEPRTGTAHAGRRVRNVGASAITWRSPIRKSHVRESPTRKARVRNVGGSTIRWREPPALEPTVTALPPPPAPIFRVFPMPNRLPVRTYETKDRSTLPEPARHAALDEQVRGHAGDGVDRGIGSKASKTGYALEPSTTSLRYPEDSSQLAGSQESTTLEEYLHRGRAKDRTSQPAGESQFAEKREEGFNEQNGKGQHKELHQHVRNDARQNEKKSWILDDDSLSGMEIQLRDLGGSYDGSHHRSASSSPKRPRNMDGYRLRDDEDPNGGQVNTVEDGDQQKHVKNRQTESHVPSPELRTAALQDLNDERVSRAIRQTSDTQSGVAKETKNPKKPKKSTKEKPKKAPRRLPDHGELVLGPERLDDSDVEVVIAPPLELSQDPISQISFEEEEDRRLNRKGTKAVNNKIPKGFGKIDIAMFRMPERPHGRIPQITIYSDGFRGKEREPIGRVMPIKQPSRRKKSCQHMTTRYGELPLVSERPLEAAPSYKKRKKSKTSKKAAVRIALPEPEDDRMLMDDTETFNVAPILRNIVLTNLEPKPQTPIILDQSLLSSTPVGNSSPLKHKSQGLHDSRAFQQSRPRVSSQQSAAAQKEALPPPSTVTKLGKNEKQRRDEQMASQEICLVTMKRPRDHNDDNEEENNQRSTAVVDERPGNGSEGESEEDGPFLTPSEDEDEDEDEDPREDDISCELDLEANVENRLGDEEAEDLVTDAGDIPAGDLAYKEGHSTQTLQPHLQEISSLVRELQQHTNSEKARLQEKRHMPVSSKLPRNRYTLKPQSPEHGSRKRPNQAIASHTSSSVKYELYSSQREQLPGENFNSSWRPRIPDTRGPDMQVDEEIIDSPTPPRERERAAMSRRQSLRRRSSVRSQSLYVVDELPEITSFEVPSATTKDSQGGSIILGDTQNFHRFFPAATPETQTREPEVEETQVVMVPNIGYFSQASQNLSQPLRPSRARLLSTPVRSRVRFEPQQEDGNGNGLMAGGVSMPASFQHTVSPVKSGPSQQPSQRRTPSQQQTSSQKSLRELTRSASAGLGTLHGSARTRMASLPFNPPFKRFFQTQGELTA